MFKAGNVVIEYRYIFNLLVYHKHRMSIQMTLNPYFAMITSNVVGEIT